MVAAAFIGPGTVTTATISGATMGYTLLWAVAFSAIATLILQEMSSRLGVAGRLGVGEALRLKFTGVTPRIMVSALVISAVLLGNAAYEAGNLTGAVLGLSTLYEPPGTVNPLVIGIAVIATALLLSGKYLLIERSLVVMVSVMGLVFIASAIMTRPAIQDLLRGLFVPSIPDNGTMMVLGIIGTTVVPYNLFLHASSAKKRWDSPEKITEAKWDTIISVVVGGIITMAILISAAALYYEGRGEITSAADLGRQLSPVLGSWSEAFIAVGFLAAGLSSSITAPLAAAFATSEILNWPSNMKSRRFRVVWGIVIMAGIIFSSMGIRPTELILFAQVANGVLLPVIAGFLVWIMNDHQLMGPFRNSVWQNAMGIFIIAITLTLGTRGILMALGII